MKAKIAVVLSLLFLVPGGLMPGGVLESRPDPRTATEKEAYESNESEILFRSKSSPNSRRRAARLRFSSDSRRGADAGRSVFFSADRIRELSFPRKLFQEDLYALLRIFRL
jgi:hypothetical protein